MKIILAVLMFASVCTGQIKYGLIDPATPDQLQLFDTKAEMIALVNSTGVRTFKINFTTLVIEQGTITIGVTFPSDTVAFLTDCGAKDTQLNSTACRSFGPNPSTDVFAGGLMTPRRATLE